jgi:hypothetical protein
MRQPWVWAVLEAGKRIENRRRNITHYRGPILLHAAKVCTSEELREGFDWMGAAGVVDHSVWAPLLEMPRGGIVGRARIVEVIPPHCAESLARASARAFGADPRWWMRDCFGYVLADVEPLPFVPWPGALGIFHVPDDYATATPPPGRIAWGPT